QDASVAAGMDLGAAVAPPIEQILSSEANASAMVSGEEAAVADIAEIMAEMTPAEAAPVAAEVKAEEPAAPKKAAAKKDDEKADEKA
ncbi:hypothetical protein, partial [Parasphingorhabdus sp.]